MEAVSQLEQQSKKARICNNRHTYYKRTRCTSMAQEEQSALPAGVINVNEDSDDDGIFHGEQKEIAKEMDELRVAKHWINQEGWDTANEVRTISKNSGAVVDLRLDWGMAKKRLMEQVDEETQCDVNQGIEAGVVRDYALDDLDPTQRVFADRVLMWAQEVADVYKDVEALVLSTLIEQKKRWNEMDQEI